MYAGQCKVTVKHCGGKDSRSVSVYLSPQHRDYVAERRQPRSKVPWKGTIHLPLSSLSNNTGSTSHGDGYPTHRKIFMGSTGSLRVMQS